MMSAPLLTIAIPTFNRHKSLKLLFESFLLEVSSKYSDQVEIIICDNSGKIEAENNCELFVNTDILYKKNERNIGYSGNIIRCINEAHGYFLWIISDDDHVDLNEFNNIMNVIPSLIDQGTGCIMLPYINSDPLGRKKLSNTSRQWGINGSTTLRKLIECNNQLPFVLFSGVIISMKNLTRQKLESVEKKFGDNDFIQIPLFLDIVTLDARVEFYPSPLQEYKLADSIRFNIENMYSSMMDIISYYLASNTVLYRKYRQRNYRLWVGWFLWDRAGLVVVPGACSFRCKLASNVVGGISFENIILTLLMFTPRGILRAGYISSVVIFGKADSGQFKIYKMWKELVFFNKK